MGVGIAVVVLLVAVAGGLLWGVWKFNSLDRVDVSLAGAQANAPQNFLIVGSDTRDLRNSGGDNGAIFGNKKDVPPGGQRADTMLIARIDPKKTTIELLSIPRDLWVDIAGKNEKERLNAAYNLGPQPLIDTIRNTFGIEINHYVEVNFVGFKGLVDAIDGVPMYFDHPMRDGNTGLNIPKKGCYTLNGVQALAFARSRHLVYSNGVKWVSDGTGDLGRITRQQVFLRRSLAKVTKLDISDLNTLRKLVDVGVDSVKIDSGLSVDDMMALAHKFAKFDSSTMVTHRVPATPFTTNGGAAVLQLDQAGAEPVLDIFRGKTPASVPSTTAPAGAGRDLVPAAISADVLNASGRTGLAKKTGDELATIGFNLGNVTSATGSASTEVHYGTGAESAAALVASHLSPEPVLVPDSTLHGDHVTVLLGSDFTKVLVVARPPAVAAGSTPTTQAPPTTGVSDKPVGISAGDPPPGVTCG